MHKDNGTVQGAKLVGKNLHKTLLGLLPNPLGCDASPGHNRVSPRLE